MPRNAAGSTPLRRSLRNVKRQSLEEDVKMKRSSTDSPLKEEPRPHPSITDIPLPKSNPPDKAAILQARKLKSFTTHSHSSPFPSFPHPTPKECSLAHGILISVHGERRRPDTIIAPSTVAGCGNSPSVLDALVRTILSQNTSDKNSTRAKLSMDKTYGGSDNWDAIVQGGTEKLQRTIRSGGLSVVKSKVIMNILHQTKAQYGSYSLDHLLNASNDAAMRELLSFQGVGPKTASCVLLFCLRRDSFAVDTHVYRISGLLGWRPASANREETQAHLEARVPDEEKYGLHVLMVTHGKNCAECRAGGKNAGKCALRSAFVKGKKDDDVKSPNEAKLIKEEEL
ncbi:base excision dna repair [Trichoderma arundinaceum]|uniref:Base excision dna repair n=1 Tax=Trichoderma arundinaceum TaxID=490622 RepID=A0A395NXJ5_TRIAR|nr:base excision dna repair [Trichoderma arundinaceum]